MRKSVTVRFVGWVVEEGDKRVGGAAQRSAAINHGIDLAKAGSAVLRILDKDGAVEETRTYGEEDGPEANTA